MRGSQATPIRLAPVAVGALIALAAVFAVRAQHLSDQDCREGSDFIRNAALSRDNGVVRSEFTDRLDGDIATVMQMPVHSRWFVYGDAEATLLRSAVAVVFNDPRPADTHHSRFMLACQQLRAETAMKLVFESSPTPVEP
jgi:hypothetical protein